MARNDYTLTIADVSKRLNKSTRTIHRYKDTGRLSFVTGTTQGNPLFFSRSEIEELERELYPRLTTAGTLNDTQFWDRLARVEQFLGVLERNPLLERVAQLASGLEDEAASDEVSKALQQLAALTEQGAAADRTALGKVFIRLGNALLNA